MRTVFKITYDVKVGRHWLGGGNANGYTSANVTASGDARVAIERLTQHVFKQDFAGSMASHIRILRVEPIAADVI